MKRLAILSAIALSSLVYNTADAQISIHFGFHLAPRRVVYVPAPEPVVVEQPTVYQEPVNVYDDSDDDDYYYLPDVDAYYDVNAGCYYYNNGDNWISAAYLPGAYRNYDWRSARRFEVREHRPYMRGDFYRERYNGRQVAEWRHFNRDNRFGNNYGYNERYNRDAYGRGYNRPDFNGGRFNRDNRNRDFNNHFGDRNQGNWGRPSDQNGGNGRGNWSQPSNQNKGGDRNRGQGGQPSNQNRDQGRDYRGGGQFARNAQPMGMSHRVATF